MDTESLPLVVGLPGPSLSDSERTVLERVRPAGIIVFARNVESAAQTRALVDQLRELDPEPFLAIDLEGGAVNRLAGLWGTLPSPARAAAAGRRAVRALGEAAGAACRSLGIHLDLAPVVDLEFPEGALARQSRCLSDDPERVVTLASVFAEGLATWCVGGCLKHFPGLGPLAADTHQELPTLDLDEAALGRQIEVFAALSERVPIVMVGHVVVPALGDAKLPASLSRPAVERAANLPGRPVVLADDLEMGALGQWEHLADRVLAALRARNHGVLVCSAFAELEAVAERIRAAATDDTAVHSRARDITSRLGTLRRDLCRTAASVPAPDDPTVEQLWEAARCAAEP